MRPTHIPVVRLALRLSVAAPVALAFTPAQVVLAQCQSFSTASATLPAGRRSSGAVKDNFGNIYVTGGALPLATATVLRFREVNGQLVDTTNSAPVMPPMSTPRAEHAVARDRHGRIYAFGGTLIAPGFSNTWERFDPITNQWSGPWLLPEARAYTRAVASLDGMSIFLLGGGNSTAYATNSVFRYDVASGSWTTEQPMLFERTQHGVAMGKDGVIYVVGALYRQPVRFEARNPHSGTWSQLPSPPVYLETAAACFADSAGRIHVLGAYEDGGWRPDTTHQVYDPVPGTWATCAPFAPPRSNMASVLSDTGRVYLFGGLTYSTPLSTILEATCPGPLLSLTQYAGAGSVDIRIVNGAPFNIALTVITLNPANNAIGGLGGLGTGWWGGLHVSLPEVIGFWSGGPPFRMSLDASGGALWSLPAGALSSLAGVTFYAASHTFEPLFGGLSGVSYPAAITLR